MTVIQIKQVYTTVEEAMTLQNVEDKEKKSTLTYKEQRNFWRKSYEKALCLDQEKEPI